ncbi:MAG: hypothetical protein QXM76_04130 [Zestosphaera sp.]
MKLVYVTLMGLSLMLTSLALGLALLIPELRLYEECRDLYTPAFRTLFVYWGNYSLPGNLKNVSLNVVSTQGITLNISYGVSFGEAHSVVTQSTFNYFVNNSTYFYLFIVPHQDTELRVCLSGLLMTLRSYLLLPTIASWSAGTVMIMYSVLMHFERMLMKSVRGRK